MKHYKLTLIILFVVLFIAAEAQLLERDNVTSKIAVGTRPQQGDMGFSLGTSFQEIQEMIDDDIDVKGFPLLVVKYYVTDNIELRLNAQSYSKSKVIEGSLVNQIGREDDTDKQTFMRYMLSGQYHFASSNLLDTYVGAGFIMGTDRNEILTTEKVNLTGDYVSNHLSKKTNSMGFNLNFGLQAFISDLPVSLGFEASMRGLRNTNLQYENEFSSSVGGVVTNQKYFSVDKDAVLRYESLDYKTFDLGADVRILLTYYFRK